MNTDQYRIPKCLKNVTRVAEIKGILKEMELRVVGTGMTGKTREKTNIDKWNDKFWATRDTKRKEIVSGLLGTEAPLKRMEFKA